MDCPQGLRFGPDGLLYVVSFLHRSVVRYHAASGKFLGVFAASAAQSGGQVDLEAGSALQALDPTPTDSLSMCYAEIFLPKEVESRSVRAEGNSLTWQGLAGVCCSQVLADSGTRWGQRCSTFFRQAKCSSAATSQTTSFASTQQMVPLQLPVAARQGWCRCVSG